MPLKNPTAKPIVGGFWYEPAGPKFEEFHARNLHTNRVLVGSYGSGKTTAALAEVLWLVLMSKTYQSKTALVITATCLTRIANHIVRIVEPL
jgi:RecG-like helicase